MAAESLFVCSSIDTSSTGYRVCTKGREHRHAVGREPREEEGRVGADLLRGTLERGRWNGSAGDQDENRMIWIPWTYDPSDGLLHTTEVCNVAGDKGGER
jgi:hypothetical protein